MWGISAGLVGNCAGVLCGSAIGDGPALQLSRAAGHGNRHRLPVLDGRQTASLIEKAACMASFLWRYGGGRARASLLPGVSLFLFFLEPHEFAPVFPALFIALSVFSLHEPEPGPTGMDVGEGPFSVPFSVLVAPVELPGGEDHPFLRVGVVVRVGAAETEYGGTGKGDGEAR